MENATKIDSNKNVEKTQKMTRTPLTPNADFWKISYDVLDVLHASRVCSVNYNSKFENHANGLIVRRVQALKCATCQQKCYTKELQQQTTQSAHGAVSSARRKILKKVDAPLQPNGLGAVAARQQ